MLLSYLQDLQLLKAARPCTAAHNSSPRPSFRSGLVLLAVLKHRVFDPLPEALAICIDKTGTR